MGETEIAKVLSSTLARRLIRLQCYEDSMSRPRFMNGTTPHR